MTATVSSGGPPFLTRLTRLRRGDWTDFLRAHWSLLRSAWTLRWRRRGDGVSVREPREHRGDAAVGSRDVRRARQLALAVDRACRWGPLRPRCLVRAVALQRLLEAAGLEGGEVRIGVQRDPDGFVAHAWVDYGGAVLGEAPESVSRYSTLDDLDVFPRR